jgi:gluconokinase
LSSYILAIDIGTTSTKALAINAMGSVLASHQFYYPTSYPKPGWAEQDVENIYHAVFSVIEATCNEIADIHALEAISFSSAMHSILAVSREGIPLTPAIIWADIRSSSIACELKNSAAGIQLHQETGTPIHPMSPLCKLMWMRENEPQFKKAFKFVSIKEYVIHKLTGEYVVDYSIASASGLFNLASKQWHPVALQLAGVSESKLSRLVSPRFALPLSDVACKDLRLSDVKIVIGASDGCLAQLGSGAMSNGELTITIGTSAAVRRAVNEIKDPQGKLFNYWLDDEVIISGGASNNGTVIVDWFNREFEKDNRTLVDFVSDALTITPGSEGMLALPYLLGERAPIYNPEAKGVFFGVSVRHTSNHFKRALLEGICYEILSMVESVEQVHGMSQRIFVSGGFTYASAWVQLLSNILNRQLIQSEVADASALGAAILGYQAVGKTLSINRNDTLIFSPDNSFAQTYSSQYKRFVTLYKALEPLFA